MKVPRTARIAPPSREQILAAPLADEQTMPAGEAYGYRGRELKASLARVPRGFFVATTAGIAFLTTGARGLDFKVLLRMMATHAVGEVAGQLVPFGRVMAGKMLHHEPVSPQVEEMLRRPETFLVPYTDIVEVSVQTAGSLWSGKHHYLVLGSEATDGATAQYNLYFGAGEIGEGRDTWILATRWKYEVDELQTTLIDELVDRSAIGNSVIDEAEAKYPDGTSAHRDEIVKEVLRRLDDRLGEKGTTMDKLLDQARAELAHFRAVPLLDRLYSRNFSV